MDQYNVLDKIKRTRSDQVIIFKDNHKLITYMNKSTFIPIQSITKFFVGLAIGILYTDKLIQLEDPVNKYLNKFPHPHITILNLLTHTSGLEYDYSTKINGHWVLTETAKKFEDWNISFDDFVYGLKKIDRRGIYHYNNFTANILTLIIRTITGLDVDQYLDEKFFRLIGFKYTWLKKNGICFGPYGLSTDANNLLLIGKVLIDNGMHNGKRIISSKYLHLQRLNYINSHGLFSENISGLNGHTGADGQYFFYNKKHRIIIIRLVEIGDNKLYPNFIPDILKYLH